MDSIRLRWRRFGIQGGVIVALLLAAVHFSSSPVVAETNPDARLCENEDNKVAKAKIAACTRLINSKRYKGGSLSSVYQNRAEGYRGLGELDRAIPDYDRAIEINPKNAIAYLNRAETYRSIGDFNRAIADATQAIRFDKAMPSAYTVRGLAYEKQGNVTRARADFKMALSMPAKYADGPWAHNVARMRLKELDAKESGGEQK
jgi:tetratricopeptide (TPR) repeat protein